MTDRLSEGEELQNLTRTAGWELVSQYLQGQISSRLKDLERTEFDDLAQVARLQGEIRGLRAIPIFMQDRQRRAAALQKEQ